MGYWTRLYIVDVNIKKDCFEKVKGIIKNHKGMRNEGLKFFLDNIYLDHERYLSFKASKKRQDYYVSDELGTTPEMDSKWYESEAIANWLKKYCASRSYIVEHSLEGDGAAWGWEFNG